MKKTLREYLIPTGIAVVSVCAMSAPAQALDASYADSAWTGESIPEGQMCQRFGGENPQSPTVNVTNIPEGSDAIVLEFSDRNVSRMDNGGHGKVGYKLAGEQTEVTVPRVPGHTMDLPENFFTVEAHKAPNWDTAGAYLPPCSGGRGNDYFIDIKAVKLGENQEVAEVLGETSIKMGTY